VVARTGAVGVGQFPYPEWHKREGEHILEQVGVKVTYLKSAEVKPKSSKRRVTPEVHTKIVRLHNEGRTIREIAQILGWSIGTVHKQLQLHRAYMEGSGSCPLCRK